MPPKRKRFGKRGTKFQRKFRKAFKKTASVGWSSSRSSRLNDSVTTLNFKASLGTRMPLPDRYLTWISLENQGSYPVGASASQSFFFALNDIVFPLNKPGPGTALPNPVLAIGTQVPVGVRNLLVSAVVPGVGIYTQFRVWSTQLELTFSPQGAGDNINIAVAPLAQAGLAVSNFQQLCSAPNAVIKQCMFGSSSESNTIRAMWSMPALAGVPKKLYPAFASAIGNGTVPPGLPYFVQVGYQTNTNAVTVAIVPVKVVIRYHVEFMNRADAALL